VNSTQIPQWNLGNYNIIFTAWLYTTVT